MYAPHSSKPHFVFLHGWGQSSQVWHQQTHTFLNLANIHMLHLPGHDGTANLDMGNWLSFLEQQLHKISNQKNIILIGWSLGGQLALALEKTPSISRIIQGLVLVSTTPCFRQRPNWHHGCSNEIWQGFSASTQDPKNLQRFFQMMLHGDKLTRREIQTIAKESINHTTPLDFGGLDAGLQLLSTLDLRQQLQNINTPTLIFHGQEDVITPVQAGQYLANNIPRSELHIFKDCGHAPFLTHHAEFNTRLEQWWKNISV